MFVLFLPKYFINLFILSETGLRIKGPALEFGLFLKFVGIWLLIAENHGTNQADYFSETFIDLFSGW